MRGPIMPVAKTDLKTGVAFKIVRAAEVSAAAWAVATTASLAHAEICGCHPTSPGAGSGA
jgi:hypothetical protein